MSTTPKPVARDLVMYVESGQAHFAFVTAVGHRDDGMPRVNLALVSTEGDMTDSYGRMIVRRTFVPHMDDDPAMPHWRRPNANDFLSVVDTPPPTETSDTTSAARHAGHRVKNVHRGGDA